jgi:hypothetical protein
MSCGKATPFQLLKLSANPPVLCATQRGWRLSNSPERSGLLINSCSEIHGACRHKPRFHRYHKQKPSADERKKRKNVVPNAMNPKRRRIDSFDTDGSESVGSHSHLGTEPCGFTSVWSNESIPRPSGRSDGRETVRSLAGKRLFERFRFKTSSSYVKIGLTLHWYCYCLYRQYYVQYLL